MVENLNVLKDGGSGLGASSKRLDNALRLEGRPETFFHGIVITVTGSAHAGRDTLLLKAGCISQAGVLTATIRVMHQLGDPRAMSERHLQSVLN